MDRDSNADCVTHPDHNAYTNRHADTDADRNTDRDADRNTDRDADCDADAGTQIGIPASL
jgi:hypothetical protein